MAVYSLTVYPSVAGGDSGELVAEACQLGVAHPPGYPLFTMLTHAWMRITAPVLGGSPAWRANLLSCVWDASAATLLMLSVVTWSGREDAAGVAVAAGAAGLFALSPVVWLYALGAEVFSLNNLFVAAIIYLTVRYARYGRFADVQLGALVCGLALCNQHTAVLLEVPLILWILSTRISVLTAGQFWTLAGLFLLGLLPYAYVPLTSTLNPLPGSWGQVVTFEGFLHHLRRADYGTFQLFSGKNAANSAGLSKRLWLYGQDLVTQESWNGTGAAAALLGAAAVVVSPGVLLLKTKGASNGADEDGAADKAATAAMRKTLGRAMVFALVFYLLVFHSLANLPLNEKLLYGVHMRFWQQPNAIVFLLAGVGAVVLLDKFAPRAGDGASSSRARKGASAASSRGKKQGRGGKKGRSGAKGSNGSAADADANAAGGDKPPRRLSNMLVPALAAVAVASQAQMHWERTDQSKGWYIRDYARALIDELPPQSLFIAAYDLQWTSLRYLQQCEGFRPDVIVVSQPMMTYDWWGSHRDRWEAHPAGSVTFPGKKMRYYQKPIMADAFSFRDFVDANIGKPHLRGGIYIAGELLYKQDGCLADDYPGQARAQETGSAAFYDKTQGYTLDPIGLVHRVVRTREHAARSASKYTAALMETWGKVHRHMTKLAPGDKYDGEFWEFTTVRHYWMQVEEGAAQATELALASRDPRLIVAAVRMYEQYLANEELANHQKHAAKNAGLSYVHLVQGKYDVPAELVKGLAGKDKQHLACLQDAMSPLLGDAGAAEWSAPFLPAQESETVASELLSLWTAFGGTTRAPDHRGFGHVPKKMTYGEEEGETWSTRASMRVLDLWSHWLTKAGSQSDPGYGAVVQAVNVLASVATGKDAPQPHTQAGGGGGASNANRKKRRPAQKKKKKSTRSKKTKAPAARKQAPSAQQEPPSEEGTSSTVFI